MKAMDRLEGFLGGFALGAGLMFLLDPQAGRRRRHLVRDKVVRGGHELSDTAEEMSARIGNKLKGIAAETRSRFASQDVDDSVLEARVRSTMGRVVSNPGAIAVVATDGRITISGPVLASEVGELLSCVQAVPGVRDVHSQFTVRPSAEGIAGLPGPERSD